MVGGAEKGVEGEIERHIDDIIVIIREKISKCIYDSMGIRGIWDEMSHIASSSATTIHTKIVHDDPDSILTSC